MCCIHLTTKLHFLIEKNKNILNNIEDLNTNMLNGILLHPIARQLRKS